MSLTIETYKNYVNKMINWLGVSDRPPVTLVSPSGDSLVDEDALKVKQVGNSVEESIFAVAPLALTTDEVQSVVISSTIMRKFARWNFIVSNSLNTSVKIALEYRAVSTDVVMENNTVSRFGLTENDVCFVVPAFRLNLPISTITARIDGTGLAAKEKNPCEWYLGEDIRVRFKASSVPTSGSFTIRLVGVSK